MIGMAFVEAGDQAALRILRKKRPDLGVLSDAAFWLADPKVCDIAIEAAITVLESIRPSGATWVDAGFGACVANSLIQSLREEEGNPSWSIQNSVAALGPIAGLMRQIPPAQLREVLKELVGRLARPVESITYSKSVDEEEDTRNTCQSTLASMFKIRRRA